ncbi:MAG TPA: GNAT family N-acetyltransferase [Rhabdaerophilum sp.]|nr:GNAT family N-acetyltransferase [Rhabdaerophilum sp.]
MIDGLESGVCQSPLWLGSWLSVFGKSVDIESFVVLLHDKAGRVRLALPLIRRAEHGLQFLEAMDNCVSDYNAPLIRREGHADLPDGDALWRLIADVLPEADVFRFERMAPRVVGMANPLFGHPRARQNRLAGWASADIENWDSFFATLSSKQRENSGKNRRRFLRQPGATFHIVNDTDRGFAALECLDAFQKGRIGDKGLDYCLDRPDIAAFYRELTLRGMASGQIVIAEMRAGDEVVAVNFAVVAGSEALYLRVGNQFGEWGKMSPGVMVTELAIEEAVRRGTKTFDFGMGDYVYKRRLGAREYPLQDLVLPLSLRGAPYALLWHARTWVSRNPLVRKLTGRAALPAGNASFEDAAA